MKEIQCTGKSVDEAIESGLAELGLKRDQVEINVIDGGSKGLFGIFGSKLAKVELKEKDTAEKRANEFLKKLLDNMDIKAEIQINDDAGNLNIKLDGESMGILIGHRGETLDAIQYLTGLVVNKGRSEYKRVIIDTENYRSKREETLRRLARKMAGIVKKTGKNVVLEPMNPYERRILHEALQDQPNIVTYSQGEEPNRRVVIAMK